MKKINLAILATLTFSLTGCYVAQNFDNQVQLSRTGQYQVNVDTDVINGVFLLAKTEDKASNKALSAKDLSEIFTKCQQEFDRAVALDAKNGHHIVSSKYLGECRGHLTLKYTGNIIQEKTFNASIGTFDSIGFEIPVTLKYDTKKKVIMLVARSKGDRSAQQKLVGFAYDGKLSVKTDGKVLFTNAETKPYWGLLGSYKWSVKDLTTPDSLLVISTSGF